MHPLEQTYLDHDMSLLKMISATVGLELAAGSSARTSGSHTAVRATAHHLRRSQYTGTGGTKRARIALWYHGLIGRAFDDQPTPQEYYYVPQDLHALLPLPIARQVPDHPAVLLTDAG